MIINFSRSVKVACLFLLFVTFLPVFSQMNWYCATPSAFVPPRWGHTSVVFDNKMWILGGYINLGYSYVWNSPDGVRWTRIDSFISWAPDFLHTSVVFDNKMWKIGGYRNGEFIWYSSDGVRWYRITNSVPWGPGRCAHTSVVFDNKIWVLGGWDENFFRYYNDVWYSSNGIDWTCATESAGWLPRAAHSSVVFDNKIWVMGGRYYRDTLLFLLNDVWYSSNGIDWTCATESAGWLPRAAHSSVVFDNKIWVMGGYYRDTLLFLLNDVWYSSNGIDWTCATESAGWLPRCAHTSVVFNDKIWVLGGFSRDSITGEEISLNDVWYSTGLGVEEKNRITQSVTPTIIRSISELVPSILLDPTGRKVVDLKSATNKNLKPGIYFLIPNTRSELRKIVLIK